MVLDDVYSMVGGRWGIMKREYRGGAGGSFAQQGRILSGKEWDRLGKDVVKCVFALLVWADFCIFLLCC